MKVLLFFFMAILLNSFSEAQVTIPLYSKVPNSKIVTSYHEGADTGADGIIRISKVSVPEITIYQPEKSGTHKKTAVIICPGGGYRMLAYNLEGTEVAEIFNRWGVTAVILKYRLPDEAIMKDKSIGPLQDVQQAIHYVRANAAILGIDPERIGVMGFSAGGHLASMAATRFRESFISKPDHLSLRPDFSILAYPVISFNDSIAHMGSRENLVGENPPLNIIRKFSGELQVSDDTPPTFLVGASDDQVVNPENSIRYYEALLSHHIKAEIHIYQDGGHGFGTRIGFSNDNWMSCLKKWMMYNHFLQEDR